MPHQHTGQRYSQEVLAWQLGHAPGPDTSSPAHPAADANAARTAATTDNAARRLLRMAQASARPKLALVGVGNGELAARLYEALHTGLHTSPRGTADLHIVESSPHRARQALQRFPELRPCLLVDTSPWALLLLTLHAGLHPGNCTMGRTSAAPGATAMAAPAGATAAPDTSAPVNDAAARALEYWRKLFLGVSPLAVPLPPADGPRISVGAILHPAEPQLEDFFRHIPPFVHEVCVVWDGAMPETPPTPCAAPLRQHVRPLNKDFSAQRNAMLAQCSGDWCLYLDADELLSPDVWAALPALVTLASQAGADCVLFPRLTFEGTEDRVRMGYGLWPDVQCRFFALHKGVHFEGTVHEQVRGLGGAGGADGHRLLAPGMPLLHYSHIQKDRARIEEKLRVFNAAAGSALHVGSAAYPSLPRDDVEALGATFGTHTVLRLP